MEFKARMSPKGRVLKAINFEEPDRVPFREDIIEWGPNHDWPHGKTKEIDGITWVMEPLISSLDDLDTVKFCNPHDKTLYTELDRIIIEKGNEYPIFVNFQGVFHDAINLRPYDDFYLEIFDRPGDIHEMMEKIAYVLEESAKIVCQKDIDALFILDDLAGQMGPLMSLPQIEEFVLAYDARPIKIAKQHNKKVAFHTDGNVMPLLDRLIEIGVDIINPLEPSENDLTAFKKKYKGRIVVYGGLDNKYIIPEDSSSKVAEHVYQTFRLLGEGGGLILGSHEVLGNVPRENFEIISTTVKERCKY